MGDIFGEESIASDRASQIERIEYFVDRSGSWACGGRGVRVEDSWGEVGFAPKGDIVRTRLRVSGFGRTVTSSSHFRKVTSRLPASPREGSLSSSSKVYASIHSARHGNIRLLLQGLAFLWYFLDNLLLVKF